MDFTKKIAGVSFKNLPPVNWEQIMMRSQIYIECNYGSVHSFFAILAKCLVRNKYNCKLYFDESSKALFHFYNWTKRTNLKRTYEEIANLSFFDKMYYDSYIRICDLKRFFELLKNLFSWYKALKDCGLSNKEKKVALSNLIDAFNFYNDILKTIPIEKYKFLLTFYDSLLLEAFTVQLFKLHSIPTVSLQHGQFTAWRENDIIYSGVELRSFQSDYLMAWNQFTIDEARKEHLRVDNMPIVGILGYVGAKFGIINNCDNKTFGVVIGHPSFETENLKLIEAANILARSRGLKFVLKLHPNYSDSFFDNFVDENYYGGVVKKGISMTDYASSVEFSVVGSSSVFVELVYLGHNTIRYSSGEIKDKYRDIELGQVIHTPEEIVKVYNDGFSPDDNDALFSYLCSVKDVTTTYQKFFNTLLNNDI